MQENIYERIQRTLTWKKIIGFNAVLFMVLIVPLSVSLTQQDTENRSNAAFEEPVVEPPANYPTLSPRIDRVNTFFGKTEIRWCSWGPTLATTSGEPCLHRQHRSTKEAIVRWSNSVLKSKYLKAPYWSGLDCVNQREARWEGSLLSSMCESYQIGLQKITSQEGKLFTLNGAGAQRGMVELSYVSEPMSIVPLPGVTISEQSPSSDSLGKKLRVRFEFATPLSSSRTELATYTYPGLGAVEIIRAELYDASGRLISIFSDPLMIKVTP
jgi:hypothetical protein